jgi:hypothetical protein
MGSFSLTGADNLVLSNQPMVDVADGDWFTLTFPNTLAEVKTGKNGNSIFASNAMGQQAEATLRLLRGSANDLFLDALLQNQIQDFSTFITLSGTFSKRIGDGQGNITPDQYVASGGIFTQEVDAKSNAEGDTEQSVSVYRMKFANVQRAAQ